MSSVVDMLITAKERNNQIYRVVNHLSMERAFIDKAVSEEISTNHRQRVALILKGDSTDYKPIGDVLPEL
jgi:ABC-type oligopeptide transport system ATPase subunit